MSPDSSSRLTCDARRRALRLGLVNIALWAIGNGLSSGPLIVYLALELGATGRSVGFILALPAAVGVLRLLAPVVIRGCGGARNACLAFSLASYFLLFGLPLMAFNQDSEALRRFQPLALLVGLLCIHQLLEYIASVALLSWLGDLIPRRLRGRYFAKRQIWQLATLIPTLLLSGYLSDRWKTLYPETLGVAYGTVCGVGAAFLLASLIPLVMMPGGRSVPALTAATSWMALPRPFADWRFQRLLLFGCWFSFFNGLTQSAQYIFPYAVLGLGLLPLAAMQTAMRMGQMAYSPWAGRFSDRYGNRPVMILSLLIVAAAPLFFLFATPERPWLLAGAWLAWSAYAGLNICLPSLMLKLSPAGNSASYIASYFSVTGLFYALSTVAGGYLLDYSKHHCAPVEIGRWTLDHFGYLFVLAWCTRNFGLIFLLRIVEPGAWRWRSLIMSRKQIRS